MTFEEEEKTKLYHSNFATYLCMMICLCSIGKHSLNKMWLYLSFPLSRYVFFSGQFTFSWKDFVERQFGQSDSDFSLLNFFWIEHFLYFPSTMYGLQISFFLSLFKASRVWKILMTLSKQQVFFGIFSQSFFESLPNIYYWVSFITNCISWQPILAQNSCDEVSWIFIQNPQFFQHKPWGHFVSY